MEIQRQRGKKEIFPWGEGRKGLGACYVGVIEQRAWGYCSESTVFLQLDQREANVEQNH